VWLFDAQVGGLALSESLRQVVLPVVCQCVIIAPLVWMILTRPSSAATNREHMRPLSRWLQLALWIFVLAGIGVTCAVPAIRVGGDTAEGLRSVFRNSAQLHMLLREVFTGLAYALIAAVIATLLVAGLIRKVGTSRLAAAGVFVAAMPGLAGSLVLGLSLIQLLQLPLARFAYKTPLSFLAGLILFLLPRAMALRYLLSSGGASAALHLAALLGESKEPPVRERSRELAWHVRWRGEFWCVALLSYWVYFDLTLAYLLAPVTIVSAPVMLYNQMHFGKNATLSALVFLTVLVPLLVFAAAAGARRLIMRWI
jgi:ABC-type Fe3+ transport system permease subunit